MKDRSSPTASRWIVTAPVLAAFVGLLFRTWDLHRMPPGLFIDTGIQGWIARGIGDFWPAPQSLMPVNGWPSLTAYALKIWMFVAGDGRVGILSFFVLVSLASFPFLHASLRRWSGPIVASSALFLLAVMRWHVTLSRNGHMAIHVPLAMFGTLYALHRGLETGRSRFFVLAGFFTAYGLYTYQAFKLFPLFLALFLWRESRERKIGIAKCVTVFAATAALLASPILVSWWVQGSLGARESQLTILHHGLREIPGLLWDNLLKTALFFHWTGDIYAFVNIPGHRVLDVVTGSLFLVGLVYALANLRRKECLYAVSGFAVMMIPALLSVDGPQSARLVGAIPFVALLASFPVREAWERSSRPGRQFWAAAGLLLALSVVFLNGRDYFLVFASHPECRSIHSVAETRIGEEVRKDPGSRFVLSPRFLQHPTVLFLAYDAQDRISPLEEALRQEPSRQERIFVVEGRKEGWSGWLKEAFAGGTEEVLRDWNGVPLARKVRVPADVALDPAMGPSVRADFYSMGSGRPVLKETRLEPVIDYSFRGDFPPIDPVFRAKWRGSVRVPSDGVYEWAVLTSGEARLRVGGRVAADTSASHTRPVTLKRGPVPVELEYQSPRPAKEEEGSWFPPTETPLQLVWKRSDANRFEVVRFTGSGLTK